MPSLVEVYDEVARDLKEVAREIEDAAQEDQPSDGLELEHCLDWLSSRRDERRSRMGSLPIEDSFLEGDSEVSKTTSVSRRDDVQVAKRERQNLVRVEEGALLGGVCTGLAQHFNLDPTWVRFAFVMGAFFAFPAFFLYLVLWVIIPSQEAPISQQLPEPKKNPDEIPPELVEAWKEIQDLDLQNG